MDNGESCYCGHCWSCDPEGNRHRQFEWLVRKANQVAHDDKLFEIERTIVNNYKPSSREWMSNLDQHYGDVFYMAASMRRDEEFFKKHGRVETIIEFLFSTF